MNSSPSPRLVVTGSLAYDYLSTYDRPFEEVLLPNRLDALSVCFVVSRKERFFGGTAGNIAYNLALLGETPTVLAGVGHDFSDYRQHLEQVGVNLEALRVSPDVPMASASIITDPRGHQITEFYPGAMGRGLKPHIQPLEQAEFVIIAPDDPGWMMEYVDLAKRFKRRTFFDPGQGLPGFSSDQLLRAIEGSEGVFVNDYELELLKKITGLPQKDLFALSRLFVVTYGERGSKLFSRNQILEIPIAPPEQVVDPTGCGDAYRAGFLKGYLGGRDLEICGRMGALMATFAVEQRGTQNHRLGWKNFVKRFEETFQKPLG